MVTILFTILKIKGRRMFACFSQFLQKLKDVRLKDLAIRFRYYAYLSMVSNHRDHMVSDKQKTVFQFALEQFHKKYDPERSRFETG